MNYSKESFEKMGISFEEESFYDILINVRYYYKFPYADDKTQFVDWSARDDLKNLLNMELTVLLYQNGYPPDWDEDLFEKVMEQAENNKKYQ